MAGDCDETAMPEAFQRLRSLWAAVLDLSCREARGVHPARRSQARTWISADRPDLPNSFVSVCDLLDIDAGRVRSKVLGSGQ